MTLVDDIHINHLSYADDLALITETETDLLCLLNVMSDWCNENFMNSNYTKTKVIHFQNWTAMRSTFQFKGREMIIEYTDNYKYLSLVLSSTDYNVTAKYIAQLAIRALDLLMLKYKQASGMPFDVYKKNIWHHSLVAKVKSEKHILLECPLYNEFREELFSKIKMLSSNFDTLSNQEKVCHLL